MPEISHSLKAILCLILLIWTRFLITYKYYMRYYIHDFSNHNITKNKNTLHYKNTK